MKEKNKKADKVYVCPRCGKEHTFGRGAGYCDYCFRSGLYNVHKMTGRKSRATEDELMSNRLNAEHIELNGIARFRVRAQRDVLWCMKTIKRLFERAEREARERCEKEGRTGPFQIKNAVDRAKQDAKDAIYAILPNDALSMIFERGAHVQNYGQISIGKLVTALATARYRDALESHDSVVETRGYASGPNSMRCVTAVANF